MLAIILSLFQWTLIFRVGDDIVPAVIDNSVSIDDPGPRHILHQFSNMPQPNGRYIFVSLLFVIFVIAKLLSLMLS